MLNRVSCSSYFMKHGFTYIEFLITLSIILSLLFLVTQNFSFLKTNNNHYILKNRVIDLLQRAKLEAKYRHQTVMVCGANDESICGDSWVMAKYLFLVSQSQKLAQLALLGGNLHGQVYPRNQSFMIFTGELTPLNNANATFWYCEKDAVVISWAIAMSKSGYVHELLADAQGIFYDSRGRLLKCAQ